MEYAGLHKHTQRWVKAGLSLDCAGFLLTLSLKPSELNPALASQDGPTLSRNFTIFYAWRRQATHKNSQNQDKDKDEDPQRSARPLLDPPSVQYPPSLPPNPTPPPPRPSPPSPPPPFPKKIGLKEKTFAQNVLLKTFGGANWRGPLGGQNHLGVQRVCRAPANFCCWLLFIVVLAV